MARKQLATKHLNENKQANKKLGAFSGNRKAKKLLLLTQRNTKRIGKPFPFGISLRDESSSWKWESLDTEIIEIIYCWNLPAEAVNKSVQVTGFVSVRFTLRLNGNGSVRCGTACFIRTNVAIFHCRWYREDITNQHEASRVLIGIVSAASG